MRSRLVAYMCGALCWMYSCIPGSVFVKKKVHSLFSEQKRVLTSLTSTAPIRSIQRLANTNSKIAIDVTLQGANLRNQSVDIPCHRVALLRPQLAQISRAAVHVDERGDAVVERLEMASHQSGEPVEFPGDVGLEDTVPVSIASTGRCWSRGDLLLPAGHERSDDQVCPMSDALAVLSGIKGLASALTVPGSNSKLRLAITVHLPDMVDHLRATQKRHPGDK